MEPIQENILDLPIGNLPLSKFAIEQLTKLKFQTLREFVQAGWSKIRQSEGFDYIWFNEVISYLDDLKLLHLMEAHNRI